MFARIPLTIFPRLYTQYKDSYIAYIGNIESTLEPELFFLSDPLMVTLTVNGYPIGYNYPIGYGYARARTRANIPKTISPGLDYIAYKGFIGKA